MFSLFFDWSRMRTKIFARIRPCDQDRRTRPRGRMEKK